MLDDLRLAARALGRAPGFTGIAILTVALAIGANTAIFSVADAVLFRPLPYRDAAKLFVIQMRSPASPRPFAMVRWDLIRAINEHHRGLGSVATIEFGPEVVATGPDGPEYIRSAAVSANYLNVVGASPARGRLLGPADAKADNRAMLSYDAWRTRFGADDAIVGARIAFGTQRYDIVGVLPRGFILPTPLARKPELVVLHDIAEDGPNSGALYPVVRLEPGTTREQAETELSTLAAATRPAGPGAGAAQPVLTDMRTVLFPAGRPIMRFLLAAALLVLLIGCANLANLFLARVQRRQRDLGVRAARGAARAQVVRPLVFEALLIGITGAATALLVTSLSFDALLDHVPTIAYGSAAVGVDMRVAAFALALGAFGAAVFALLALWRASTLDILAIIQRRLSGSPSVSRRFGQPMVAVQVAVAVVLVFGAAVAGQALLSVIRTPLGFSADRVVEIAVVPPPAYAGRQREFYTSLVERLRGIPDVEVAGATSALPLTGPAMWDSFPGADGKPVAGMDLVLPGYLDALSARLIAGRLPRPGDERAASVVVLSDAAARLLTPGGDPIGRTVRNSSGRQLTVIGVVSDLRVRLDGTDVPATYALPLPERALMTVVARVRQRDDAALAAIRQLTVAHAGGTPVAAAWWADEIDDITPYRNPRFQTIVLGGFAALAVVLTATGIFGLISFVVASRTNELGIRASMGATPDSLVRSIVLQSMAPVGTGVAVGLAASRGLARLAEAQLYDVQTEDPVTLATTAAVVLIAALAAAYWPARRARHADPLAMLRAE